ncbi:hypothetical protein EGW08_009611 [Elysia chlorotica]|uniref:Coiled-coil domain-containing protein 24 n=1 Tax=Elysia chlorotica TaxID=188477 RepID=A0A433TM54_ELYCH|nr:hypothetical protein EGW08_009611 [Elysia chlorotica]
MAGLRAAYTPPLSLWKLVEQHVELHEQDELKDMLGCSLVEQSLELHAEIDMLLEIWREVREESEETSRALSYLPEPPDQRDRLVQEICFFVDNVKEQAKKKGIDPEHIFKNHNSGILDYAAEMARPESARSRTSRSSDGRDTPMSVLSPERIDLAYNMTGEIQAVNKQLNFLDFGKVCESLRCYLEKEVDQLLGDVQFLQTCLDDAADRRDCHTPALSSREPTLTELREERSLLEKELFATEKISSGPFVNKPMFTATNRVLPRTPPTPIGQHSPGSPPLLKTISRPSHVTPGPLRANHQVLGASSKNSAGGMNRMTAEQDGRTCLDVSPESDQSDFSLEEEIFGPLNMGSIRLSSNENTNDLNEIFDEQQQLPERLSNIDQGRKYQSRACHDKTPHGFSKSGSSLEKEKSSLRTLRTVLPTPPTRPALAQPSAPHGMTSHQLPSHSDPNLSHQLAPPSLRANTVVSGAARSRRRTVSPRPRLRVVDVTNIVEAQAGKGDSDIPCHTAETVINFSPGSSSASSYTSPTSMDGVSVSPSSQDGLIERDHRMRPGSANRFRKMVLGCRNGE